jgi:hypothetical protein
MLNALPYLILISFYGIMALCQYYQKEKEKQIYLNFICLFVFILFFGFRGYIFYDWTSYSYIYNNLPGFSTLFTQNILKWPWEPGFTLLAVTCKSIFPDYQFFVLSCCLINTWLLTKFFNRYIDNLPLAFMIFLCMRGVVLSTDLMRNSISIFLFINALKYIENKKPLPYFCICCLAISFHSSALVYLPMYFILNRKYNKWVLLSIFIAANVIYLLHISFLKNIILLFVNVLSPSTKLWVNVYLDMDANIGSIFSIGYLERLFTGILLFCYIQKLIDIRNNSSIFVNSMFLYLLIYLSLSEFRTISVRCATLFCFAYWIIWIDLIKCFYYRNNRLLFISFIGLYCLLKTYGDFHGAMSNYYNILFEKRTYTERVLYFMQHFNDKE